MGKREKDKNAILLVCGHAESRRCRLGVGNLASRGGGEPQVDGSLLLAAGRRDGSDLLRSTRAILMIRD